MPKHRLKSLSLIVIALTLWLVLSLTACAPSATKESNLPTGQITILKNGADFAVVQISSIGSADVSATFKKKDGAPEDHVYHASEMSVVLTAAGLSELAAASKIVVTAKDGFAATFTLDEVQKNTTVYLASKIDQQPITGSDGKSAAMIVVPGDAFSNRWVGDILSIDLISD
jgi:hypothetical protein